MLINIQFLRRMTFLPLFVGSQTIALAGGNRNPSRHPG